MDGTGPVLRAHIIRQDGYRYYMDDLVPGRAEGSLVAGESPGQWSGGGATALGLLGEVTSGEFRAVLEGRDPRSGTALRHRRGVRTVDGYDLTFGAPKSVSILHLLAPREMADEVGAGHHAAVAEAVGYLGRTAVGVRRVVQGEVRSLPATGPVAGSFVHRTSRALDPHLHTHAVVANVAQGVDGGWSTLDSRRLFAHIGAARSVYHARLRLEMADRLGAAWDVPVNGLGDIVGVDARLRRLFSVRAASMEQYRFERNGATSRPVRSTGAFHATRPDKDRTRSVESLVGEWQQRASDFGHDLGELTTVVGRARGPQGPAERFELGRVQERLGTLVADGRTVRHPDVVAAVACAAVGGATAQTIESVADRIGRAVDGSPWSSAALASLTAADLTVDGPDRHLPARAVALDGADRRIERTAPPSGGPPGLARSVDPVSRAAGRWLGR